MNRIKAILIQDPKEAKDVEALGVGDASSRYALLPMYIDNYFFDCFDVDESKIFPYKGKEEECGIEIDGDFYHVCLDTESTWTVLTNSLLGVNLVNDGSLQARLYSYFMTTRDYSGSASVEFDCRKQVFDVITSYGGRLPFDFIDLVEDTKENFNAKFSRIESYCLSEDDRKGIVDKIKKSIATQMSEFAADESHDFIRTVFDGIHIFISSVIDEGSGEFSDLLPKESMKNLVNTFARKGLFRNVKMSAFDEKMTLGDVYDLFCMFEDGITESAFADYVPNFETLRKCFPKGFKKEYASYKRFLQ